MKKNYELTLILPSETTEKAGVAILAGLLAKSGGKVVSTTNWGVKDLAYSIKKQARGMYLFFDLELASTEAVELDKRLRLAEEIVRYLLVQTSTKVISKPSLKEEKKNGRAKSK